MIQKITKIFQELNGLSINQNLQDQIQYCQKKTFVKHNRQHICNIKLANFQAKQKELTSKILPRKIEDSIILSKKDIDEEMDNILSKITELNTKINKTHISIQQTLQSIQQTLQSINEIEQIKLEKDDDNQSDNIIDQEISKLIFQKRSLQHKYDSFLKNELEYKREIENQNNLYLVFTKMHHKTQYFKKKKQ